MGLNTQPYPLIKSLKGFLLYIQQDHHLHTQQAIYQQEHGDRSHWPLYYLYSSTMGSRKEINTVSFCSFIQVKPEEIVHGDIPGRHTAGAISKLSHCDYTCYSMRDDNNRVVAVIIRAKKKTKHTKFKNAIA